MSFAEFAVCITVSFNEKAYFTGYADKQIGKIRQMAVGCEQLQYLVNNTCSPPQRCIQPNRHVIKKALSESHVDTISSG